VTHKNNYKQIMYIKSYSHTNKNNHNPNNNESVMSLMPAGLRLDDKVSRRRSASRRFCVDAGLRLDDKVSRRRSASRRFCVDAGLRLDDRSLDADLRLGASA